MKSLTSRCGIVISILCRPEAAFGAQASPTDKTLVSWVTLDNTSQRGGSVLTLQQGAQFDGIVFGEISNGKWMAGSNGFARTETAQDGNAAETADGNTLIQIAIVYKSNRISIYRNAEQYASYDADNIDQLTPEGRTCGQTDTAIALTLKRSLNSISLEMVSFGPIRSISPQHQVTPAR